MHRPTRVDAESPKEKAAACPRFVFDCEEECEDDDVSCRNCRYRRWTREGFLCMKEINP